MIEYEIGDCVVVKSGNYIDKTGKSLIGNVGEVIDFSIKGAFTTVIVRNMDGKTSYRWPSFILRKANGIEILSAKATK